MAKVIPQFFCYWCKRELEIGEEIQSDEVLIGKEGKDKLDSIEKSDNIIEEIDRINKNLVKFYHRITEFEIKLKYLYLKDLKGNKYGENFPPVRSDILLVDEEDRSYNLKVAGNNQVSGDIIDFITANNLKVGDVIYIEYNPNQEVKDGKHIVHMKLKK